MCMNECCRLLKPVTHLNRVQKLSERHLLLTPASKPCAGALTVLNADLCATGMLSAPQRQCNAAHESVVSTFTWRCDVDVCMITYKACSMYFRGAILPELMRRSGSPRRHVHVPFCGMLC